MADLRCAGALLGVTALYIGLVAAVARLLGPAGGAVGLAAALLGGLVVAAGIVLCEHGSRAWRFVLITVLLCAAGSGIGGRFLVRGAGYWFVLVHLGTAALVFVAGRRLVPAGFGGFSPRPRRGPGPFWLLVMSLLSQGGSCALDARVRDYEFEEAFLFTQMVLAWIPLVAVTARLPLALAGVAHGLFVISAWYLVYAEVFWAQFAVVGMAALALAVLARYRPPRSA